MNSSLVLLLLAASPSMPGLGVSDFAANGASPELASALTSVTANEVQRLGLFRVTTSDAMRSLLGLERQRQLLGCTEGGCGSLDMKVLVGFDYLLTGKVTRLAGARTAPPSFTFELLLLNPRSSLREASDIQTASSEGELLGLVNKSLLKVLSKVLAGRQGSLLVISTEAGAEVKLDDVTVGTTPLPPRAVAAGPHFLSVEKEGFVSHQKELRISPDRVTQEPVHLVPSPDTIGAYESRNSKLRLGAWIGTGAAVAGFAAAAALQVRAVGLYGAPDRPGTFAAHRDALLKGVETEGEVDHRSAVSALRSQIETSQMLSYVGAGVGAAGAVTALALWIWGDDPGRYSDFKEHAPVVGLSPAPGGFSTVVSASF